MKELPAFWSNVIEVMTKYLENHEDHWTLQTYGEPYKFGPYVQVLQEHDNMLLVEATSNKFLEPPLSPQQHEAMLFLGWRFYPEDYYPNFSQILDQSKYSPREIAELLAKTLHFAYGVDQSFAFEIVPGRGDAELLLNGTRSLQMTQAEADINFPAVLIKLTLHDIDRMSDDDIYEATRKSWRIAEDRRNGGPKSPTFAVSVYQNSVVAVFEIFAWESAEEGTRWAFIGKLDSEKTGSNKGKSVAHLYQQGAQNPIKYLNCSDLDEPSLGAEDLVEAIINVRHFGQSRHPDYWSTMETLMREKLGIGPDDQRGYWLEGVLNGPNALTMQILPTEGALEMSHDHPMGVATSAVWGKFSKAIEKMHIDLIEINREFLTALIRNILGADASRRIVLSELIAAGLPETEPQWSVFDWAENY